MAPMDPSGSCEQLQGLQEFLDKPCPSEEKQEHYEGQTSCKTEEPNNLKPGHKMGGHFSKDDSNINVQHQDMDQEIRHLKNEAQKAEALLRSQSEMIQELQESWNNCQDEIKMLKKEKFDLRSIILSSNGPEQVSDDEMKSLFATIRQKIQAIAHSNALDLERNVALLSAQNANWYRFYESWNHISLTDRSLKMRGKIFEILCDQILKKKLFGISPVGDSGLKQIELSLEKLEKLMRKEKVPDDTITDWRLSTMKAIDETKIAHTCPCPAAHGIWAIFQCLLRKETDYSATDKLSNEVVQLCKDAYYLRSMMRGSKDRYRCELFRSGANFHDFETYLEVCGVEHGGNASSIIAFVVSGALVKQPQNANEQAIVLEPAHVVVRQA
ncbi:hypothetical protein VFPPC_03139 [Pochonia chlamydosporia 170]|uniref:Uncharacterized protein n=1 Tax=Pochonia chlamydosporia 170 TaxID=1380566 RepID=A0A179FZ97_METCM|nr:hypothetical protein VFPPC_03139 [Pochonia chlamydosporia 170]OAQ70707.1 hypothetical protein VFPPC_03139 [Pochonia chlamydosporia 170]